MWPKLFYIQPKGVTFTQVCIEYLHFSIYVHFAGLIHHSTKCDRERSAATQTNPEMAAERRIELVGGELALDRCDAVEKVPGVTEAPWDE